MTNEILIFHFICQFLLNFIDEKNIKKSWMFKQKTKYALNQFYEAFESQMNVYLKGDDKRQLEAFNNEILHNTQQGVLSIKEYFNILFALPHLEEQELAAFQKEYYELLDKYNLSKELIK